MQSKPKAQADGQRIGLYVRVSTEEQASNPEGSIKSQEQRLRSHIQFRNQESHFGEVYAVYVDRARSGKDTNRPELQRLLATIREKKITMVMVTELSRLSRLSRSIKDFCDIWQLMQSHGCEFQSLREQFDTTSAAGEMVLYTIANIAQFERRQTSERTAANFRARAERGLYNGGCIPFGFERHPDNKGYLVANEEDAAVVREAFATFLREGSLAAAGKSLNDRGYRMKRKQEGGGRQTRLGHFTPDNLYGLLINKAYIGVRVFQANGEERTSKAVWDAMVDKERFEKAGQILKKNFRRLKTTMNKRYPFMLTGITFCAKCGDRLPGKSAHGNGGKYPYYEHGWAMKRQAYLNKRIFNCDPHRVRAESIEEKIWTEIMKILSEPGLGASIIAEAHAIHGKENHGGELEKARGRVKAIEDQIEALAEHLAKIPKSVSPLPVYRQMERLESLKSKAQSAFQDIEAASFTRDIPATVRDYSSYLEQLTKLLDGPDSADLRAKIAAKLLYKVEVKPKGAFRYHVFVGKHQISPDDSKGPPPRPPVVRPPENKKGIGGALPPLQVPFKNFGSNTLDENRGGRI